MIGKGLAKRLGIVAWQGRPGGPDRRRAARRGGDRRRLREGAAGPRQRSPLLRRAAAAGVRPRPDRGRRTPGRAASRRCRAPDPHPAGRRDRALGDGQAAGARHRRRAPGHGGRGQRQVDTARDQRRSRRPVHQRAGGNGSTCGSASPSRRSTRAAPSTAAPRPTPSAPARCRRASPSPSANASTTRPCKPCFTTTTPARSRRSGSTSTSICVEGRAETRCHRAHARQRPGLVAGGRGRTQETV